MCNFTLHHVISLVMNARFHTWKAVVLSLSIRMFKIQWQIKFSPSCSKPKLKIIQGSLFMTVALPQSLHLFFPAAWWPCVLLHSLWQYFYSYSWPNVQLGRFWCYAHCVPPSDSSMWHISRIHWPCIIARPLGHTCTYSLPLHWLGCTSFWNQWWKSISWCLWTWIPICFTIVVLHSLSLKYKAAAKRSPFSKLNLC